MLCPLLCVRLHPKLMADCECSGDDTDRQCSDVESEVLVHFLRIQSVSKVGGGWQNRRGQPNFFGAVCAHFNPLPKFLDSPLSPVYGRRTTLRLEVNAIDLTQSQRGTYYAYTGTYKYLYCVLSNGERVRVRSRPLIGNHVQFQPRPARDQSAPVQCSASAYQALSPGPPP